MKITVQENLDIKKDVLALGLFEEDKELYARYNPALSDELKQALDKELFKKEFGEFYQTSVTNSMYKRIITIYLGKKNEMTAEKLRRAMSKVVEFLKKSKLESATTNIAMLCSKTVPDLTLGMASAEGLVLADYSFEKYKSKKNGKEHSVSIQYKGKDFESGIATGTVIAESANYAKDMVNEPSCTVTPEYLEQEAKSLAKDKRVTLKVLNIEDMKKQGLNAIAAVSAGSDRRPKLIILQYKVDGNAPYTAIVGKGITFDSGGYDLKPSEYMDDMKDDMAGGAAVLATIRTALALNIKANIIGAIPACENLINGSAYRVGDIVKAYNGKTIEIKNTDAEGRLILADALSYVEKNYAPQTIIDLATLTGACVIAFGYNASGLISNNEALQAALVKAGNESYDRVWPFPFFEEYQDNMDGDISDLKNMSNKPDRRAAGSITAGVFLSKFVDKAAWAHIDIAGPAFVHEDKYYTQKYATGAGSRLLAYYFMSKK